MEVFLSADGGETYSPLLSKKTKAKINRAAKNLGKGLKSAQDAKQKRKQTKADSKLMLAKGQLAAGKSLGKSSPMPASSSPEVTSTDKPKGLSTVVIVGGGAAILLLLVGGFYLATKNKK